MYQTQMLQLQKIIGKNYIKIRLLLVHTVVYLAATKRPRTLYISDELNTNDEGHIEC